jgi:hypothetical protein
MNTFFQDTDAAFAGKIFNDMIYLISDGTEMVKEVVKTETISAPVMPVAEEKVTEKIVAEPVTTKTTEIPKINIPKVSKPEVKEEKVAVAETFKISVLGNNQKNILVLVNNKDTDYLNAEQSELLSKILAAVDVTMLDAGIVNMAKYKNFKWEDLKQQVNFTKMIAFEPAIASLYSPLNVGLYNIQKADNIDFFLSENLNDISRDVEKKKKLWAALKVFFKKS